MLNGWIVILEHCEMQVTGLKIERLEFHGMLIFQAWEIDDIKMNVWIHERHGLLYPISVQSSMKLFHSF